MLYFPRKPRFSVVVSGGGGGGGVDSVSLKNAIYIYMRVFLCIFFFIPQYHNYPHSVLKDPEFAPARMVLSQRLNELRALSQANGTANSNRNTHLDPNKSEFAFTEARYGSKIADPQALMQSGLLGTSNPQVCC